MSILRHLEKLVREMISEKAYPVLAKVDRLSPDSYTCDCVELSNLGEETKIIYTRVQIPRLIASKNGGIFLTPNKGTVVLLNFLNGDKNYPIISAMIGGDKKPNSPEDKLIITAGGKDLGKILVDMCKKISELTTTGSPTTQTLRPDQITDWKMFIENDIKKLFSVKK